jgi:RNA polymerase sigma factor (sigma-70 family)
VFDVGLTFTRSLAFTKHRMDAREALPPFQAVLDEHAEIVLRVLRGMVGPFDADDCFQETFVSALRAYPRLEHGRELRAWILTIARRKALDHHRATARRPVPVAEPPEPAAESDLNGGAQAEALWAVVAGLPEGQRAAVALRFAGGLRYREIGAALGCAEDAARRRVHDGLRALRRRGPEIEELIR